MEVRINYACIDGAVRVGCFCIVEVKVLLHMLGDFFYYRKNPLRKGFS